MVRHLNELIDVLGPSTRPERIDTLRNFVVVGLWIGKTFDSTSEAFRFAGVTERVAAK